MLNIIQEMYFEISSRIKTDILGLGTGYLVDGDSSLAKLPLDISPMTEYLADYWPTVKLTDRLLHCRDVSSTGRLADEYIFKSPPPFTAW